MSDSYTGVGQLSSDTAAYEALSYFALRPQLYFDAIVDVKPTNQTHRGSSVTFFIYDDLAAQTSALSETVDPDAIAASDTTVVATPVEQGAVLKTTAKLRATSLLPVDADMANLIGYNAGISLDTLAQTVVSGGSNVRYAGTASSRATVVPTSTIASANVQRARVDLVNANVMPTNGSLYWSFIHADVSYDLQRDTSTGNWLTPHQYSAPENIWSGEIGAFNGFRFVETPRALLVADAGSSPTTTDVYCTLFGGKQALALAHGNSEGYGRYPTIVRGPMVDALQRIQPIGWKWFGVYKRFREASLRRVESGSSIGAN